MDARLCVRRSLRACRPADASLDAPRVRGTLRACRPADASLDAPCARPSRPACLSRHPQDGEAPAAPGQSGPRQPVGPTAASVGPDRGIARRRLARRGRAVLRTRTPTRRIARSSDGVSPPRSARRHPLTTSPDHIDTERAAQVRLIHRTRSSEFVHRQRHPPRALSPPRDTVAACVPLAAASVAVSTSTAMDGRALEWTARWRPELWCASGVGSTRMPTPARPVGPRRSTEGHSPA